MPVDLLDDDGPFGIFTESVVLGEEDRKNWDEIDGKNWDEIDGKHWDGVDGKNWDEVGGKNWDEVHDEIPEDDKLDGEDRKKWNEFHGGFPNFGPELLNWKPDQDRIPRPGPSKSKSLVRFERALARAKSVKPSRQQKKLKTPCKQENANRPGSASIDKSAASTIEFNSAFNDRVLTSTDEQLDISRKDMADLWTLLDGPQEPGEMSTTGQAVHVKHAGPTTQVLDCHNRWMEIHMINEWHEYLSIPRGERKGDEVLETMNAQEFRAFFVQVQSKYLDAYKLFGEDLIQL